MRKQMRVFVGVDAMCRSDFFRK